MCATLLQMHVAELMRVNDKSNFVAAFFVLSEISDASEHSESKFYYLGKLSDAKLLQSPTHSESKERNSTLLTNEEVHNFPRSQPRKKKNFFG